MALALLIKIGSLFTIALGAYALVKLRVLRSEDSRTLSLIMLYLICPCTIISAFQIDSTPELRSGLLLAFAAAVIIHVGLLIFNMIIRKPLRRQPYHSYCVRAARSGMGRIHMCIHMRTDSAPMDTLQAAYLR